jgi:hypothetical protein
MPHDADWDADSISLEKVRERLNRYRLAVTGLPKGNYQLTVSGDPIAEFGSQELAAGVMDARSSPGMTAERFVVDYRLFRAGGVTVSGLDSNEDLRCRRSAPSV